MNNPEEFRYHERIIANPKFYKDTYWGLHSGLHSPSPEILSARSLFMVDMKSSRDKLIKEHGYLRSYQFEFGLDVTRGD